MRQIKQTYLLFLIVIGLISLSVYSTYALFTASFEITDVVDLQATLQTENDFFEYESISIPAGSTKTVEVNVSNDDTSNAMYYGIWYEILNATDTSKVSVGLYSDADDTLSSGQIPPGKTFTALVGIKNKGSSAVIVNLGSVGSKTSNLGIESPKKLLNMGWSPETVPSAMVTLTKLGLTVNSDTPNFSNTSCTDTTVCEEATVGIYETVDDLGTSYYFRGDVVNNYVKFGKNASNQDMWWRIIRINGDGTVRMIYDGTSAHSNGESSADRQVTTKLFNSKCDDNTYVGYMFGTAGATTYNDTHSNSTDSIIKKYLEGDGTTSNEGWYKDNIIDTGYGSYVADAIYCNDRSLSTADASYTGIGTTKSFYGAYQRNYTNKSPSLICNSNNNNADKFTTTTSLGNGKNKYPVGLITADEVAYAGGVYGSSNTNKNYYLYTGNSIWTMSPSYFAGSCASVFRVVSSGYLNNDLVDDSYGVRPVVSLGSNVLQYGSGSPLDPFRVE